jgi:hypothetical protein
MSDIVERCKLLAARFFDCSEGAQLLRQAATEIDRLRAELDYERGERRVLGLRLEGTIARAEKAEKEIGDWIQETQDQHDQAQDRVALMRERAERAEAALRGMLEEWDRQSRYGSPMAKADNPRVQAARAVLATAAEPEANGGGSRS